MGLERKSEEDPLDQVELTMSTKKLGRDGV